MAIRWIFFDVGSTLADESLACRHRMEEALAGAGIPFEEDWAKVEAYFNRGLRGDRAVLAEYGLKPPRWRHEEERPFPDAEPCLRALHGRYKLGVIANQSLGTAERLEQWGLLKYIDLVVASAEAGVSKPDPAIFRLALEQAGCRPEAAVMVGDRLDNDIAPAKALGMKTIRVRRGYYQLAGPKSPAEEPWRTVEGLGEIAGILELI